MRAIVREWGVAAPTTTPSTTTPIVVGGVIGIVAGGGIGALLAKSLGWKTTSAAALGAGVGAVAGGVIGNATSTPAAASPAGGGGGGTPAGGSSGGGGGGGSPTGSGTNCTTNPALCYGIDQNYNILQNLPPSVISRAYPTQPTATPPSTPIAHAPVGWQANAPVQPVPPQTVSIDSSGNVHPSGASLAAFKGTLVINLDSGQILGVTPSNSNWTASLNATKSAAYVTLDGTPGSIDIDWGTQPQQLIVTTITLT